MAKKKKRLTGMTKTFVKAFTTPERARAPSYRKMFRDARRTLEEKRGRGPRDALMQGQSPAEYAQRVREVAREALLDEHVPTRRCALCGDLRLRSRQWVKLSESQARAIEYATGELLTVICKSCKMRHEK